MANPYSPADFINYTGDPENLTQIIIERAKFSRLTDEQVAEVYETENQIARIYEDISYWLLSAAWDLHANDAELGARVKDFLEEIELLKYLSEAYKWASLFDEAYIILHPDWENTSSNLRPIGIAHRHQRMSWADTEENPYPGLEVFRQQGQLVTYSPKQLMLVESQDSFRKLYPAFNNYLLAHESARQLAGFSSLLTIAVEELLDDQFKFQNDDQYIDFLSEISAEFNRQFNNNGVCTVPGNARIEHFERDASNALEYINHASDRLLSASGFPEMHLFGKSTRGSNLAGYDSATENFINRMVKSRRERSFSSIVNFFIERFLIGINSDPRSVKVNFKIQESESAQQEAENQLIRAKRLEILLSYGVISPEEVRASYLGRSGTQDLVISDSQDSLEYKVKYQYFNKLWEEYTSRVNMSFEELNAWKLKPEARYNTQDWVFINCNLILFACTKEEIQQSSELTKWLERLVKRLKGLSLNPAHENLHDCQKCWGFDWGKTLAAAAAKLPAQQRQLTQAVFKKDNLAGVGEVGDSAGSAGSAIAKPSNQKPSPEDNPEEGN